jgi:dipeptidyl-peptidase-4
MKSRLIPFILLLLSGSLVCAQNAKKLSVEDYERAASMLSKNLNGYIKNSIRPRWLNENKVWYELKTGDQVTYKLFDPAKSKMITNDSQSELFKKGKVSSIENQSSRVSPDGKYTAFIREWNLWMKENETGNEIQLTTDGVKDFGYATDNAGWRQSDRAIVSWSPDSKKIATYQQDQRHVHDMYLVKTKVGAPELMAWKYPLPGDEQIIKIHRVIIDISINPKITRMKLAPDDRRGTLCDDISCEGGFDDVAWSNDCKKLVFVSTSRDHKEAHVRLADTETGEVREIFEEIVETQYESGQGGINWRYFSATNEIIWYSERSDWGHLYMYDATTGSLKHQITSGEYVVREILQIDEENRVIYFIASGKEEGVNPYFKYLYRVDFSGNNLKLLTPEPGDHTIRFSPNGQYFTDTYSQPDVAPVYTVRDIDGKLIEALGKMDISELETLGWQPPEVFTVKSADRRWDLYGLMYTPKNLDPSQKYPVIVRIYPGPQGGSVGSWSFYSARRDNHALTELGFVVVELEGTCNPDRSKPFHDACYGNMGDNTLPDQVSGLQQLASRHTYLDLDRVGIWGHSGGGFATAAAMFKYPDFFKVGISESGNHDNRNYEDDWGERYIGLETNYEYGSSNYEGQANQIHAPNLKGKLLLIHGAMDDNVPPYNTYLVVDALVKANKDFDMIILPHARHGYGKDSNYIMRRRWDYFVEHLLGAKPPKEFEIE